MKALVLVLALCVAAFAIGRLSVSYAVPPLALADLRVVCVNYREEREDDLSRLRRFLERASWSSARPYWKEPWDYRLKDGRVLRIDSLTALFTIEGVPGHYEISTADQKAFRQLFYVRAAAR
jgi:hypothetical protein